MAANDGEHPVTDLFGWRLPAGTGAPGTQGVQPGTTGPELGTAGIRTFDSGTRNVGTVVVHAGDSAVEGQTQDGWTGITEQEITETGAGRGQNGDHFPRYSWQQAAR